MLADKGCRSILESYDAALIISTIASRSFGLGRNPSAPALYELLTSSGWTFAEITMIRG